MLNLRKLSGQMIGNYQLRELYGAGGMGAVYRAYQVNLERDVALKVMSVNYADDPEFIKRFQREAKVAAALEHPHIVPVYDYGAYEGVLYVVMRLLTGGSLQDRIRQRQGQRPSAGEIAVVLKQLAGALDYAHSKQVIHRDVKSGNVMFDNHGTAYLVDFGIARLLQDNSTRLTADGTTVGTPTHMAPELWLGENPTPGADQYALAVVVYELLTGRLPFEAPTPYALMTKHLQEAPPPPQSLDPSLPAALTPIIGRALAKDKARRYPTLTAFASAFEEAAARSPGKPTQMFTFALRRDLLQTDVLPDTPPPPSPLQVTQPRPQAGTPTFRFDESQLSPRPPSPRSGEAFYPPAQPASRPAAPPPPAQNYSSQAAYPPQPPAQAQPYPPQPPAQKPPVPRSGQRARPQGQPLSPVPAARPAAERVVIVEREKAKNEDSLAEEVGRGVVRGTFGLVGRFLSFLLSLVGIIIKQALKSTIAFILTLLFSTVLAIIIGMFVVAMFQSHFDVGMALEQMRQFVESFLNQFRPEIPVQ